MNAILREEYEAPVLTNEAIEVHLSYLRPAVEKLIEKVDALDEKLNGKVDALNERIDALAEKFDGKFDGLNEKVDGLAKEFNGKLGALSGKFDGKFDALAGKFDGKFDALAGRVDEKIDQANKERAAGDAALGEKIDKLSELALKNQGTLKAMGWLISIVSVLASAVSIAHTLEWL